MVFTNNQSKTASFSFEGSRYRCTNGRFNTTGVRNKKGLEDFLKKNPAFEAVKEKEPTKKAPVTGGGPDDGLGEKSLEELQQIAIDEKVDSPSVIERIKGEETLIEKIREARV